MHREQKTLVRRAVQEDGPCLLRLVEELARYEKLKAPDAEAQRRLLADLFGPSPRLEALVGFSRGVPAGYAFILETYSSFLALPTLYLEDLFVLPDHRESGLGSELFLAAAREARARGCGRMEWAVLDWNTLAIRFYERRGAGHMKEWQLWRLTAGEIDALLGGRPSTG